MIGNELEIEIIELFRKDITRLLSINKIAKELGKTYPYIYKKLTGFIDEGIFKKTRIGSSILCSINLQNEEAILLLSINEILKKKELLSNNPEIKEQLNKIKELNKKITVHTAIRVENKLIIVTENQVYKKTLEKEFLNCNVLTKQEFKEQAIEDKSIIQDHILLYHKEKYYEIIGEIENELKIKNFPIYN